MLHVSPRSGQARRTNRWAGWIASVLVLCALAAPVAQAQQTAPTLAQAAALARDGQHLAAAARYEQLARRGFMSWDAATALLAAREYVIGGAVECRCHQTFGKEGGIEGCGIAAIGAHQPAQLDFRSLSGCRPALVCFKIFRRPWLAETSAITPIRSPRRQPMRSTR